MTYPKRLIEVDLPIKRISAHARREKSIRHGHISTLHIWWARRPLAACRAVICASLWIDPADELCPQVFREKAVEIITQFAKKAAMDKDLSAHCSTENWGKWQGLVKSEKPLDATNPKHWHTLRYLLLDFIADFANWDNSTQPDYLETARALTQAAHEALGGEVGTRPLVVDPFAGGGSIPLEALRVGADAFASDLNPVAVLLNKVVLEYIPKYGQRLADEVRKWGQWVKDEAEKELAEFYPKDEDGSTPIAYLWARTIISEAPDDGSGIPVEVPLMRSLWLAKKAGRYKALRWVRDDRGVVQTEVLEVTYHKSPSQISIAVDRTSCPISVRVRRPLLEIFEPKSEKEVEKGTVARGSATCPVTGYTTPVVSVRKQLKERKGGANDARLFCVVLTKQSTQGRFYRLPNVKDLEVTEKAVKALREFTNLDLIPNEPTPMGGGSGAGRAFSQRNYGMNNFVDLFSPRQLLSLATLAKLVQKIQISQENPIPIPVGRTSCPTTIPTISNSSNDDDNDSQDDCPTDFNDFNNDVWFDRSNLKITYRGKLPHWEAAGSVYFITFSTYQKLELTPVARQVVFDSCKFFDGQKYRLFAFVIMPDHVHLLIQPLPKKAGEFWQLADVLRSIKGYSAKQIPKVMKHIGTVWQDSRYDRIVRDERELRDIWEYIRQNPVKAELSNTPEEYPFFWQLESDNTTNTSSIPVIPVGRTSCPTINHKLKDNFDNEKLVDGDDRDNDSQDDCPTGLGFGDLDKNFVNAIQTCLALAVDRQANTLTSLSRWDIARENNQGLFVRQAIPMLWDFSEANPLSGSSGDLDGALAWIFDVCKSNAHLEGIAGQTEQTSATNLYYLPDDSIHFLCTDPPYYDAVPYADLSDFFYVWLKRTLPSNLLANFSNELTPKDDECIVDEVKGKDKAFFERTMGKAMAEGRRVVAPNGIGLIVFAHKSTAGWEAQLQAMIDAGWVITGSWTIDTEMGNRLRAMNSAALASSVHLVCRPRQIPNQTPVGQTSCLTLNNENGQENNEKGQDDHSTGINTNNFSEIGDWRDVLQELPKRIKEWMPRLTEQGVVGADAIFACLGPALEIFSRYSSVEKASGEIVPLREYLEYVWAAISKEALSTIFKDADTSNFEEDARLTAMWLWTLSAGDGETGKTESTDKMSVLQEDETDDDDEENTGKKAKVTGFSLEYDAARKIAQGLGAHLETLTHLVEVKGDKARLLPVKERAAYLFGKEGITPDIPKKKAKGDKQLTITGILAELPEDEHGEIKISRIGETVCNKVHQAMLLFNSGRSEALKRFLVDEGIGNDTRFWQLAQSFSALYPAGTDEKRWVDGLLARKKGLGL